MSHSVEYRRAYLAALVAAMARGDSTLPQHHPQSAPLEEPVLPECLDLLLRDLEDQRGGPEYLSQALSAASLLLSQWPDSRFDMFYCLFSLFWNTLTCSSDFLLIFVLISLKISLFQRLCNVLECQRLPDAPEVLRMACAEALCVAPLINLREHSAAIMSRYEESQKVLYTHGADIKNVESFWFRLINTGLCLLQDQSQQVRMKAACFTSVLHHVRRGESQKRIYLMQVNQALPLLLDVLLEQCWDTPGTLEVLLFNLPQSDLRSVLREASESVYVTSLNQYTCTNRATVIKCCLIIRIAVYFRCSSLYEQDEANVFAEPSVMAAHVLPYLLQMADRYSESSALARSLSTWTEQNAAQVVESLAVCKKLKPGTTIACQSM